MHAKAGGFEQEPGLLKGSARRTGCLMACVLVACAGWGSPAYARTVPLSGDLFQETPGFPTDPTDPRCLPAPDDPTYVDCAFAGTTATFIGTWLGQDRTQGRIRINLETFAATGTATATVYGYSDGIGFGQVTFEGAFTVSAPDDQGVQILEEEPRIVSGDGAFADSRGKLNIRAELRGGVGYGTYDGKWVLPGR